MTNAPGPAETLAAKSHLVVLSSGMRDPQTAQGIPIDGHWADLAANHPHPGR